MKKPNNWKTLRLVIELPVRSTKISEKDLSAAVKLTLSDFYVYRHLRNKDENISLGNLQVKEYKRHVRAEKRKSEAALAKLINSA